MLTHNILPQVDKNKQEIKRILIKYHLRPLKRMRQNFLVDQIVIKQLIESSHINKQDTIIEIGAGLGNLTKILAQKAEKVIAVEKDKRLARFLGNKFNKINNVELIEGDILKIDIDKWNLGKYKVIANLPFNITFKVIKQFLTTKNPPELLALIIQKEVGERICPKLNKNNFWSIFVELYARAEVISRIRQDAFWPKPKVKTVIIQIKPKKINLSDEKIKNILKLAKIGFKHPRKQLINNLEEGLKMKKTIIKKWLDKSKISLQKRPENLSLNDWERLSQTYTTLE